MRTLSPAGDRFVAQAPGKGTGRIRPLARPCPSFAAVIFDAYGTLLDVHAAMARHAARIGPHWQAISADWRAKQIEYAWVRSLAGPDAPS